MFTVKEVSMTKLVFNDFGTPITDEGENPIGIVNEVSNSSPG